MKKINMDFNEPDPKKMRLIQDEINFFGLNVGDRIVIFDEDFQVEAVVRHDEEKNRWYGEVVSDYVYISSEIAEAREDGLKAGEFWGRIFCRNEMIRKMIKHNISRDLIKEITGISEEALKSGYKV